MRDTIMAYGLDPNEILMKMDLKGRTKLTSQEICLALQRIDPSLNPNPALLTISEKVIISSFPIQRGSASSNIFLTVS